MLGATLAAPDAMASMHLAASLGVEIYRLQRPSIHGGSHARHPILSASVDESWQACQRRPHLNDGLLGRRGMSPNRLHQPPNRRVTPLTQRFPCFEHCPL